MITLSRSWLRPWRWSLQLNGRCVGCIVKQRGSYVVHDLDGEVWFTATSRQEALARLQALQLLLS